MELYEYEIETAIAVENGAEFFDFTWPGWGWSVDPLTLDMASWRKCVVGQLVGSIYSYRQFGILNHTRAEELGLFRPISSSGINLRYWEQCWKEQIWDRRARSMV